MRIDLLVSDALFAGAQIGLVAYGSAATTGFVGKYYVEYIRL